LRKRLLAIEVLLEVPEDTGLGGSTGEWRVRGRTGGSQSRDLVTSLEVDAGLSARAADTLRATGYKPHLVVGDGLAGYADRAPYDRIIATCSVRHIPWAWLDQAAPGARIVATLSGWMNGSGLAALTVADDGTANGRFLPGMVSFMSARAHAAPPLDPMLPNRDGDVRAARYGADILDDWTADFLAQLAAPTVSSVEVSYDGAPIRHPADRAGHRVLRMAHRRRRRDGYPARADPDLGPGRRDPGELGRRGPPGSGAAHHRDHPGRPDRGAGLRRDTQVLATACPRH
jgi:hypothetical protein